MKDYYSILGVDQQASQQDIKGAFRRLAKEFHPDKVPAERKHEAEERFKEIAEAYDTLGDDAKRRQYDASKSGFTVSLDEIFRGRSHRGADIRGTIEVPLEHAVHGAVTSVSLKRLSQCDACSGSGSADGKMVTCGSCGGVGVVTREINNGFFRMSSRSVCAVCGGTGRMPSSPCGTCHGRRCAVRDEAVQVRVPAGVATGDTIMVPGKGSWGPSGNGDLVVMIKVLPHPSFQRVGDDLVTSVKVPLLTAISGGQASLRGLCGEEIVVSIPRPCQHGHEVVVPGKGARAGVMRVKILFDLPSVDDQCMNSLRSILP